MSKPLLSILIPTVYGREESLNILFKKIVEEAHIIKVGEYSKSYKCYSIREGLDCYEWHGVLQCIRAKDNKETTIGAKRELLYNVSNGLYSLQIDDDDLIADNAIELILEAIKQEPDCITFKEKCVINGEYKASNFSLQYDDWQDNFDGFDWVRTPFYKCVIKTDIAKKVPFENIRYGEDHAWARALKPHLKTEVHIDEELYYYIHNSKPEDHNERYGFNKEV